MIIRVTLESTNASGIPNSPVHAEVEIPDGDYARAVAIDVPIPVNSPTETPWARLIYFPFTLTDDGMYIRWERATDDPPLGSYDGNSAGYSDHDFGDRS